jgi:hypothetical protein
MKCGKVYRGLRVADTLYDEANRVTPLAGSAAPAIFRGVRCASSRPRSARAARVRFLSLAQVMADRISAPPVRAPEFPDTLDWIHTGGRRLGLAHFPGKLLLLDFWTNG